MVAEDGIVESPNVAGQIAELVQKLQSSRARDRWNAADSLRRLGRGTDGVSVAVPALLHCAEDEDDDVRCAAARALGHIGTETCAPELVRLLADEDGGVRWGAAEALGNLGAAASCGVAQLKEALEDEEEDVRGTSAQSLSKLVKRGAVAAADVVPSFIECLADDEWTVRRSVAEALGRCGTAASDAVATLRRVAELDSNVSVRKAAEFALNSILGPSQA
eukprot:s428_g21.t1